MTTMVIEENAILYAMLNKKPNRCRIIQVGFGGDDQCLVCSMEDQQFFIVDMFELCENEVDCVNAYEARVAEQYAMYCKNMDTETNLILSLIYAIKTNKKFDDIEMAAAIDKATEFTQIDVYDYIEMIEKSEKKNERDMEEMI